MDYDLCRIHPNHGASDLPPAAKYPVVASFWAASAIARAKMTTITKALKQGGYQARFKSLGNGAARYCVVATDASMETLRDVASDVFPRLAVDGRSMKEHFLAFDQSIYDGLLK